MKTYRNLMITMVLGGCGTGRRGRSWRGAHSTAPAWSPSTRSGAVCDAGVGALGVTFHLIVFGWILFRSGSLDVAGSFLSRLTVPGDGDLWTAPIVLGDRRRDRAAAAAVGSRVERLPVADRAVPARALGAVFAVLVLFVGATVSAKASRRSSTSASDVSPPTDDSLMNRFDEHGLRRFRARDAIIAVTLTSLLLVLFGAPRSGAPASRWTRCRQGRGAGGRQAGGLDRRPAAAGPVAHDATAWLSPDSRSTSATRSRRPPP